MVGQALCFGSYPGTESLEVHEKELEQLLLHAVLLGDAERSRRLFRACLFSGNACLSSVVF